MSLNGLVSDKYVNPKAYYQARNRSSVRTSLDRLLTSWRPRLCTIFEQTKIIFVFKGKAILDTIRSHGGRIQARVGCPWSADAHHGRAAWAPKGIGIDRALPAPPLPATVPGTAGARVPGRGTGTRRADDPVRVRWHRQEGRATRRGRASTVRSTPRDRLVGDRARPDRRDTGRYRVHPHGSDSNGDGRP